MSHSLTLISWIEKPDAFNDPDFRFLNVSHKFKDHRIDWDYADLGKLWNYNLNYMDYLLQKDLGKERGILLIQDFIKNISGKSPGLDSYPISLRGINWIKFVTRHEIQNTEINRSLFAQYMILLHNLEYHLLGNHLLENGFSLLYGAYYFCDQRFYKKAKEIILTELKEQILADGGHFERSTMYHKIILDRLLDCINLLQNNERFSDQEILSAQMRSKGVLMVQWLNSMTFSNGQTPMLNDSTAGIAPSTEELNNYAISLGLINEVLIGENPWHTNLKNSGYRRFNGLNFECIIDVGHIGPDYQPGHAHADTFNFVLCIQGKPVIVDVGVSTYEKNKRRQIERSTSSHNTVQINKHDSSEVWGGFRVARRAKIIFLEEYQNIITARHDGYKHLDIIHERSFSFSDNCLKTTDNIICKRQVHSTARLHMHPDVKFQKIGNTIFIDGLKIEFFGQDSISIFDFMFAKQYNVLVPSKAIEITFKGHLESVLTFD